MAITCDHCGRSIAGRAITIQSHDHRSLFEFQYDEYCAGRVEEMLEDRRRWAHGDATASGLSWKLVSERFGRRSGVLEPRHANRILTLCRERGIDRDELAEALVTSRGGVGKWLKSYMTAHGQLMGITPKWAKRLVMFFDLDSTEDLFERTVTGDAPAEEFEQVTE